MGAGEAIITNVNGCVAIVGEQENGSPLGRRAGEAPHGTRYEAEIEQLEPVSTVGSGDAFLAGYVAARYEGLSPRECLAYGVACVISFTSWRMSSWRRLTSHFPIPVAPSSSERNRHKAA